MIPWKQIGPWELWGPLKTGPFGIIVALGVLYGSHLCTVYQKRKNLNPEHMRQLVFWTVVWGFVGAHVFDALFYQWEEVKADPLLLLKIWAGISSFGGFLGGGIFVSVYLIRHKLHFSAYGDALTWGLFVGFTIGRIACTIVFDHPGTTTDFVLAFDKNGIGTHNLAFYELLYLLPMMAILGYFVKKNTMPHGFVMGFVGLGYAPPRFFLDFLRLETTDPRWAGLTFAQWTAVALAVCGIYALFRAFSRAGKDRSSWGAPLADIDYPAGYLAAVQRANSSAASGGQTQKQNRNKSRKKNSKKR